jgi:membrane fusion protein (multidrug efflux system)
MADRKGGALGRLRRPARPLRPVSTLLFLLAAALAGCDDGPEADRAAQAAPPPAVSVLPVARTDLVEAVDFVGRLEAVDAVDLRARVQGVLVERRFVEGQDVEVGDVLFVIEPDEYRAAVALAEANLQRARAAVPQAENALARAEQLFQRGNVSEAALDEAIAAADQARAEQAAREAALSAARLELDDTRIAAPIAGRIGRAEYSVGSLIGPDSGVLAEITALDPIHALFSVSEAVLIDFRQQRLAGGQSGDLSDVVLALQLPNDTTYGETGRIDFVASTVDETTGTVTVRGVFPNPHRLLLPGQFVTVRVSGREPRSVLTVPQSAVQQDQAGPFVLTVDEAGAVATRRVATGAQDGADWVIEDGLAEGDLVIVQGLQRVRPGMEVTVTPAEPAAGG